MRRLVFALLSCLLATAPLAAAGAPPRPLTPAQWLADIDALQAAMPRLHGNLYHTVSEPALREAFAALRQELPRLNNDQVFVRLLRIVGMIQDGHNRIRAHCGGEREPIESPTYLPLRLALDERGVYVQNIAPAWARLVGGRVVAIDGRPVERVWAEVQPLVPHDPGNLPYTRAHASAYLTCPPVLHGLGVTASADRARFLIERPDGQREEVTLAPERLSWRSQYEDPPAGWADARLPGAPTPLWQRHPEDNFWFEHLPAQRLVYAQLRGVANGRKETLAATAARLGAFVESHDVDRLVLDLRQNGGGNNHLLRPLLVGLIRSKVNRRGHLYVLIGPVTFSAAQNLVNRLEAYTEAIFVGEPTGENVNFYGDAERLILPQSGLTVQLANLRWQDADPRDRRVATAPELAAPLRFADYRHGRDPAFELVATMPPPAALTEVLTAAAAKGKDAAWAAYQAYLADPLHRHVDDAENRINDLGYELLGSGRKPAATAVLWANAQGHPRSWNAWDSLGEAYVATGQVADAIAAYQRSVALRPDSPSGVEALRRLGASERDKPRPGQAAPGR